MFKSTKLLALAGLATVAAGVLAPVAADTDPTKSGSSVVSYESGSNVIQGEGGWVMTIPATIRLTNANSQSTGNVTLKAGPGYTMNDFATLTVKTTVTSQNAYKLVGTDVDGVAREAAYSYTLGGETLSGSGAKSIKDFDKNNTVNGEEVRQGTYKLTKKLGVQGTFTDTLTYNFDATYTYS